jgi:hypothetical protein
MADLFMRLAIVASRALGPDTAARPAPPPPPPPHAFGKHTAPEFRETTKGDRPMRCASCVITVALLAAVLPRQCRAGEPDALQLVFASGAAVPGLPKGFTYSFGIPALQVTPKGNLLAFCQANLMGGEQELELGQQGKGSTAGGHPATVGTASSGSEADGRGGWTDIALRRSTDDGRTWGPLQVICRNSTLDAAGKRNKTLEHTCQQPAPVSDNVKNKTIFLSSMDNWFQRSIESLDDGAKCRTLSWFPNFRISSGSRSFTKTGSGHAHTEGNRFSC